MIRLWMASESESLSQAAVEHFCQPEPKSQDSIPLITDYFWKGAWKTKLLMLQDLIMLSDIFPFSSHLDSFMVQILSPQFFFHNLFNNDH